MFLSFLSWFLSFDLYCSTVWLSTPRRTSIDFIYVCMFLRASFIFTTGDVSVIVPECSFAFAYLLFYFYLDLLKFLTYKSVILVHLFHSCTKVVKMWWKFLQFFWLISILISNFTHARIYHSLWFRYLIESWGEFIIHFFENWSSLRETKYINSYFFFTN